ncbi:HD domain-containing protein [Dactylosporangium sp. NPDC005555]|uniref:HD domain-containing protein n=1 Tax=Dactylosporangium sp. NPDC005555 TaxID=3154889 RepID=UPI0033AC9757
MTFDDFFRRAAGHQPDPALRRLAREGLPGEVEVPAGVPRTSIVLVWLWRRRYDQGHRRLIYALPRGAGVEPVAGDVVRWLAALDLTDRVGVHTVMAGAGEADRRWRLDPHRPAIVIGAADALVSKALNRGYALSRAMYPIDFALVTNGAQWIVDEPGLSPAATATLRRVVAFTRPAPGGSWPTAEPLALTCVSTAGAPRPAIVMRPHVRGIEREDLLAWFDTTDDVDVTPYVSDTGDFDVQVAWARWTPAGPDGRPAAEVRVPEQRWRHLVPSGDLRAFAERVAVWWFDHAEGDWSRVLAGSPLRPGETVLVAARDGGCDPRTGFDPAGTDPVEPAPDVDPVPRQQEPTGWLSLDRHSADVRDQVRALLTAIGPALPPGAAHAAVVAGHAHDLGKAHPTWQDALCALAGDPEPAWITAGRPWAKSGIDAPLRFRDDVAFRHELGSLLLLDGPLRGLLDGIADPDLVRYLVLAHHGNLRVRIPPPGDVGAGDAVPVPATHGHPAGTLTVDQDGIQETWTRTATGLRDRYGPFLLAYLETLVRIADWRASAGLPEAR